MTMKHKKSAIALAKIHRQVEFHPLKWRMKNGSLLQTF